MDLLWLILSLTGLALFQSLFFIALFFTILLLNKRLFKKFPGIRMLLLTLFFVIFISMALTSGSGWRLFSATGTAHALLFALIPPIINFPGIFIRITRCKRFNENLHPGDNPGHLFALRKLVSLVWEKSIQIFVDSLNLRR